MLKEIIEHIRRRAQFGGDPRIYLLNKLPRQAVCAEIGVWKGEFSKRILDITSPKELHLIDPWRFQAEYPERMYGGKVARNQRDMDEIFRSVSALFADNQVVRLHRGPSRDVLSSFKDETFDWIYVDGNHHYEYVLEDLELGFRKIKRGGVLVGDDFRWGADLQYPVMRAVGDFLENEQTAGPLKVFDTQFFIPKS